ncbi:MAG: hypothetical protein E7058_06800 [Lentisphaerae bacterium]|nr:hypothetical protein [Lentisphaerota bacterium]
MLKRYLPALLMFCGLILGAGEFSDKGIISGWKYSPLQVDVGLLKNRKLMDETTDCTVAFGVFLLQQKSAVVSVALIANTLQNNYGIQLSPLFMGVATDRNYGISCGLTNYSKKCYGIQLGVWNYSFAGNEIAKENERVQFCGVNIADAVYLGIANFSNEFQIGLFNFSKEATFQLGLLNYNPKSYLPYLPLVNWDMGRDVKNENRKKELKTHENHL